MVSEARKALPAALVTAAIFLVTLAVNLEVPLYREYASRAHYGHGRLAVVFACYVAGLLPVLIFLGGVSDRLGRKAVVLTGMTLASSATALVLVSPTMQTVLVARLLQGIAVGLTVGTGTAYLAELSGGDALRASKLVAVATSLGFGGGALLTTIAVAASPHPLAHPPLVPWSYPLALAATAACAVAVAVACPRLPPLGGALVRLPFVPTGTATAGLAIAVAWAISGLVIAVVPSQLAARGLGVWSGPCLFLVNCAGALVQPRARAMPSRRAIALGLWAVPTGYLLLVGGAQLGALPVVFLGACLAGISGYGFIYLGGLALVAEAAGSQRARGVAGFFLFAYVGFGLPSVVIGFGADAIGVDAAMWAFGAVVLAMSAALLVLARRQADRL